MEEILLAILVGAGLVTAVTKTDIGRNVAKSIIKTGYGVAATTSSVCSSAVESLQNLMSESKAEFDAAQTSETPEPTTETVPKHQ